MAYLLNRGLDERQEEFFVENASEISKLPTMTSEGDRTASYGKAYRKVAAGSKALVIPTGEIYILTTSNTWDKFGG